MTTIPELQPSVGNKKFTKRWILYSSVLVVLLIGFLGLKAISSNRISEVNGSNVPNSGILQSTPSPTNAGNTTKTVPAATIAAATVTPTLSPTQKSTLTPTSTPEIYANVIYDDIKLYAEPNDSTDVIRKVDRSDKLILTGQVRNKVWFKVKTSDGQEGWLYTSFVNLDGINLDKLPYVTPVPAKIPTPVALPGIEGHWIDIDLSDQMVYAWDGSELKGSFLVSTGTHLYPTVIGQYHVYAKFPSIDMDGADFFLPDVPSAMFYDGNYSIHGTYWHHNFGTPMSHGCVNMSMEDAEWLYEFSDLGTLVNIHW